MEKKKVLILSPLPEEAVRALLSTRVPSHEIEDVSLVSYNGSSQSDLVRAVSDADVILGDYTNNVAMDADVMRAAKKCLLIQQPSTGYQHIDVGAAAKEGIPVANIAGANTNAVAEHTIMVILACLKNLLLAHKKTLHGEWAQDEMPLYGVHELWNKTLGIIGMGRIGREVAKRAKAFGPSIVYFDIDRLEPGVEGDLGVSYLELDRLIAESDVVTVHIPYTPQTEDLITADLIARMKPNAVIINVSRGGIVNEGALAQALHAKRIRGAALDVFSREPLDAGNPLLSAPNVILTPHIAGATNESRDRITDMTIDNIVNVLRGREPMNIVNGVKPRSSR